jgi:L-amino acid N-acyltransferase YncA
MIRLLINELLDSKSDVKELVGQVKYENYASAKVFEKCNFIRMGKADYIEYYLAMEKKHEDNNSNY